MKGNPRLVADLSSIETAITSFSLDVRSGFPGRLEHLTRELVPSSPDHTLVDGRPYSYQDAESWGGPYLDRPIEEWIGEFEVAAESGSEDGILNGLTCYDPDANLDTGTFCGGGVRFVAVRIVGLDQEEFDTVSALLDGTPNNLEGEIRYDTSTGLTYFLAVPYVE